MNVRLAIFLDVLLSARMSLGRAGLPKVLCDLTLNVEEQELQCQS
jgi:hypothetical protein